jgi:hypothetical protein
MAAAGDAATVTCVVCAMARRTTPDVADSGEVRSVDHPPGYRLGIQVASASYCEKRVEPSDLTVDILRSIRNEVTSLRTELRTEVSELRAEVHGLREELGQRIDDVHRYMVGVELRTATSLTDLYGTLREVLDTLRG